MVRGYVNTEKGVSVKCGPDGGGWFMADRKMRMIKCGWKNADGKLRMIKCGWKNADDKMRMGKKGRQNADSLSRILL